MAPMGGPSTTCSHQLQPCVLQVLAEPPKQEWEIQCIFCTNAHKTNFKWFYVCQTISHFYVFIHDVVSSNVIKTVRAWRNTFPSCFSNRFSLFFLHHSLLHQFLWLPSQIHRFQCNQCNRYVSKHITLHTKLYAEKLCSIWTFARSYSLYSFTEILKRWKKLLFIRKHDYKGTKIGEHSVLCFL